VFLVLFVEARLFADSALQVVYVLLSLAGLWLWLRGGERGKARPVARIARREACLVAAGNLVAF
jgi:nicotinamide mononucleotide transporter